jgi:hypothetical protein
MIDSTSSPGGANRAGEVPEGNGKHATPESAGGKRDRRSAAERPRKAPFGEAEIRPDVVARGRKLAADPDYPSASVIQRVAAMIVNSRGLSGNRDSGR